MTPYLDALRARRAEAQAELEAITERHAALLGILENIDNLLCLEGGVVTHEEAGESPETATSGSGDLDGASVARSPLPSPIDEDAAYAADNAQERGPCACSREWRNKVGRFVEDVANEAHHPDCPRYRAGAHYFPIPTALGDEGVDVTCLWCGEVKHFGANIDSAEQGKWVQHAGVPEPPTVGNGNLAKDPRQRQICPDCGGHKNSVLHKTACKAGRLAVPS